MWVTKLTIPFHSYKFSQEKIYKKGDIVRRYAAADFDNSFLFANLDRF